MKPIAKPSIMPAAKAAELLPPRPPTGKFALVAEEAKKLKPNESMVVKGSHTPAEARALIRHITGALQTRKIKAPAGYGFYKAVGRSGEVIVTVRPRKPRSK